MENCFATRTSERMTIQCYICEKRFNSKCFDLSYPQTLKSLSSASNALFMCQKCIERVTKLKQNLRKSSDSLATVSTTRHSSQLPDNTNSVQNDGEILSNVLTILKDFDQKFKVLNDSNEEIKRKIDDVHHTNQIDQTEPFASLIKSEISTISQSMSILHAKVDHQSTSQRTADVKSSSLIMDKLNEINDKCNIPTIQSNSMNSGIRKIITTPMSRCKDPLDWSFSCNQSMLMNDNNELFQMLSGFEKNTWASFDYLRHKLNDTNDTISNIEMLCKNNIGINDCRLESPVIESIKIDALQVIHEKFEEIERQLTDIGRNLKSKAVDDHLRDESPAVTQRLRERFLNLISSDSSECHSEHNNALPADMTTNNLDQFPPIDELLIINPTNSDTDDIDSRFSHATPTNVTSKRCLHLLGNGVPSAFLKHNFHISPFNTSVSPDDIMQYIAENAAIDKNQLIIRRLTKNGQDLSTLRHINFKIETNATIAKEILESNFWPKHIKIKPWVSKSKPSQHPLPTSFLSNKPT